MSGFRQPREYTYVFKDLLVELRGFEPLTSEMRQTEVPAGKTMIEQTAERVEVNAIAAPGR
jgi:hypothetical protein